MFTLPGLEWHCENGHFVAYAERGDVFRPEKYSKGCPICKEKVSLKIVGRYSDLAGNSSQQAFSRRQNP